MQEHGNGCRRQGLERSFKDVCLDVPREIDLSKPRVELKARNLEEVEPSGYVKQIACAMNFLICKYNKCCKITCSYPIIKYL